MVKMSAQVAEACKAAGIAEEELEIMLQRSAPFTHEWANRRFKGWMFSVNLSSMDCKRMSAINCTPVQKPSDYMEDDCPECLGEGCDHCRQSGVQKTKVYLTNPKTVI